MAQRKKQSAQRLETEKRLGRQDTSKFLLSVLVLIVGIAMIFISLFIPPKGVIDASVLAALGELLTFVAAVWGLSSYTTMQIRKIDNATNNRLGDAE